MALRLRPQLLIAQSLFCLNRKIRFYFSSSFFVGGVPEATLESMLTQFITSMGEAHFSCSTVEFLMLAASASSE